MTRYVPFAMMPPPPVPLNPRLIASSSDGLVIAPLLRSKTPEELPVSQRNVLRPLFFAERFTYSCQYSREASLRLARCAAAYSPMITGVPALTHLFLTREKRSSTYGSCAHEHWLYCGYGDPHARQGPFGLIVKSYGS